MCRYIVLKVMTTIVGMNECMYAFIILFVYVNTFESVLQIAKISVLNE